MSSISARLLFAPLSSEERRLLFAYVLYAPFCPAAHAPCLSLSIIFTLIIDMRLFSPMFISSRAMMMPPRVERHATRGAASVAYVMLFLSALSFDAAR